MPRRQIADSAALRTGQFADGGKCASTAILYPQRSIAARNTMGLPHWSHDRKCFYKYASAATAKLILEKNSLRWALPTSFNILCPDVESRWLFALSLWDFPNMSLSYSFTWHGSWYQMAQ
jgi:hypothetical protein